MLQFGHEPATQTRCMVHAEKAIGLCLDRPGGILCYVKLSSDLQPRAIDAKAVQVSESAQRERFAPEVFLGDAL